jgi:hypothetical protein
MYKRYFLFLFLTYFSFSGLAQEATDEVYYRHFSIAIKNLSNEEYQELQNTFSEIANFNAVSYCSSSGSFLLQVDASYPARVSQIESEINGFVIQSIPQRRITSIESISDLDKTNFCK